ncbi:putative transporter [Lipomyces arxii]|uniref:putative transporter n=1 Tax=Lipomyces arxii TaxID=56418 RepID=UPI0034CE98E6
MDMRFLPILSLLYLFSFMCRGRIGNAKTFELQHTLNLTNQQYAVAWPIFFISYALFDVPANMILKKLRPSIWLPSVMVATSIVMTLTGIVNSSSGLIVARWFLGLVEAGLFPGVTYCISVCYCRNEAQFRNALFFCAASIAGALAGLLAYGPHYMEERAFIEYRIRHDGEMVHEGEEKPESAEEIEAEAEEEEAENMHFSDYRIYLHVIIYWGVGRPLYSISLFLSTIILNLGYSSAQANLLSVPIYVLACILAFIAAFYSNKLQKRAAFVFLSCSFMILGFIIAVAAPVSKPGMAYADVFIAASGVYPGFSGLIAWCSNNMLGYKRSIGVAMQVNIGSFSGAMAVNFYRPQDAPRYVLGHCLNIMFIALAIIAICNRKKDAMTEEDIKKLGKTQKEFRAMDEQSPYFRYLM